MSTFSYIIKEFRQGSSTDRPLQAQVFKMTLALVWILVCDAEHPLLPVIIYLLAKGVGFLLLLKNNFTAICP